MKKPKILLLALSLLAVAAGVLLYIFLPPILPEADNNTPARELISHYYSDEELEAILKRTDEEVYYSPFEYETLNDLKHIYKFECLRNPSVYSDEYYPYIVLMAESGKKLYLFYDPQTLEIIDRTIIEDFMTLSELQTVISNESANNNDSSHLRAILQNCNTGVHLMSVCMYYLCGVEEGVLAVSMWNGAPIRIRSMDFYPNELIFADKPLDMSGRPFELWPVLPIDKTE